MMYTIHIMNNSTKEIKEYVDDYNWEKESTLLFMYGEGNYSCDCNRSIFFFSDFEEAVECSFETNNFIIVEWLSYFKRSSIKIKHEGVIPCLRKK